ncbi:MAG: alpha/beta hydrolase [Fibrobacteria bacterium]|nr:alpha/beta hydrolase [Fibrobacteria bacterium]
MINQNILRSSFFISLFLFVSSMQAAVSYIDVETYKHSTETLYARISIPDTTGPFPVILAFHGGGFTGADRKRFKDSFHEHCNSLGFAVVSAEYRLITEGGKHPNAVKDAMHTLHWIIDKADVYNFDTSRIVTLGSSAGAYLAIMIGLTCGQEDFQPDFGPYQGKTAQVKAVVSSMAMYDWSAISEGSGYIGNYRNVPSASPVHNARGIGCENFILFGGENDLDWSPQATAYAMHDSLIAAEKYSEVHIMENQGHQGFYEYSNEFEIWCWDSLEVFLDKKVITKPVSVFANNLFYKQQPVQGRLLFLKDLSGTGSLITGGQVYDITGKKRRDQVFQNGVLLLRP